MVINYQANKHDRRVSQLRLRRVNAFSFSLQNLLQDTYETVFWWSSQCLLMTNTLGRYMELLGAPVQCTNCWSLGRSSISPTQSALSCDLFPIHIRVQDDAGRLWWRIVSAKIGNKVSLPDIWVWKMTIFYSIKYEAIVMSRMRGINVLRLLRGYKSSAFNRPSVWSVLAV